MYESTQSDSVDVPIRRRSLSRPVLAIIAIGGVFFGGIGVHETHASLFSTLSGFFNKRPAAIQDVATSQNIDLLDPSVVRVKSFNVEESEANVLVVDESAHMPGTPSSALITTYVVRDGDSIGKIAQMYNVSANTIIWTNNLNRNAPLKPGQTLVILPVNGITHVVKSGETIEGIVKKHKGDVQEVLDFNGLTAGQSLKIGDRIVIPDGEPEVAPAPTAKPSDTKRAAAPSKLKETSGYFMRPISGGVRTVGIHGYNGIDIAAPVGTPIYAAAAGTIVISRGNGAWNGGYGNYVVISHKNGTQTLYAHMSRTAIASGATVDKGDVIGYVGSTGKSTGPHLHFEVRGGKNPF